MMSGKKIWIICAFLLLAVLGAVTALCNHRISQSDSPSEYAPAQSDRLTVYTSLEESVYLPLVREFEERTGIWVQVENGNTLELLSRIRLEDSGTTCDVFFGGGIDSLTANSDLFQAEAVYSCSLHPLVLIYNPVLVRRNLPSGWESLFLPAWKGKIAYTDPETSGTGYTALATLLQLTPGEHEEELIQRFLANLNDTLLPDDSAIISEVAAGNCYIGITTEEAALKAVDNGYDIGIVYPAEGTSIVPDGLGICTYAPHAENGAQFIDFVLSGNVQSHLAEYNSRRSADPAVPIPETLPGLLLLPYDIEESAADQQHILTLWHQLLEEVSP